MTGFPGLKSNRGVALLLALLVTALLLALVFEFAYATRISLRAAQNFRDSERASFLARSGVNYAGKFLANGRLQDRLPQGEWTTVPMVSDGDTELRIRWEDEGGKLNIATVKKTTETEIYSLYTRLTNLFGDSEVGISLEALDKMAEKQNFYLLSELHQVLGDEDFGKIKDYVTVYNTSQNISINTASEAVLRSLGMSAQQASLIAEKRRREPFATRQDISGFQGMQQYASLVPYLRENSDVFKVSSFATVGNYTKQIEAVVQTAGTGFTLVYWRSL